MKEKRCGNDKNEVIACDALKVEDNLYAKDVREVAWCIFLIKLQAVCRGYIQRVKYWRTKHKKDSDRMMDLDMLLTFNVANINLENAQEVVLYQAKTKQAPLKPRPRKSPQQWSTVLRRTSARYRRPRCAPAERRPQSATALRSETTRALFLGKMPMAATSIRRT
jgi:hypothetical protein